MINGLAYGNEHFVMQGNFQQTKMFSELINRLTVCDDSDKARCGKGSGRGHIVMQIEEMKKIVSSNGCSKKSIIKNYV